MGMFTKLDEVEEEMMDQYYRLLKEQTHSECGKGAPWLHNDYLHFDKQTCVVCGEPLENHQCPTTV